MVGVPVGLALYFLFVLLFLFFRLEQQASDNDNSKTIIARANSLVKEYYDAASQLITLKHITDPEEQAKATQQFEHKLEKIEASYLGLEELVKTDAEDMKMVLKMEKITHAGISLMKRYENHVLGKETLEGLQVGILYKELDLTGEKFTYWLDQLSSRETKKYKINSREEKGTRLLVKVFIISGAIVAIAFGSGLIFYFTKKTTNRLAMLMDNTLRLTKKEPLLPMLQGKDEISQLDLFFHNMAEQLAEATRKERAILDNAVDVICSINKDGYFAAVNPASKQVWGYDPEEIIGMHYSQLIAEPDVQKFN